MVIALSLLLGFLPTACRTGGAKARTPATSTPTSVEIKPHAGRPTIFVNGKAETPMIYSITDSPGGRWTWEEVPQWNIANFGRAGFRIIQFSVWLEDIWKPDGRLDVDLVRRQFRGVLDVVPNAVVFLRLHINAPFWWNAAHPDETVAFADTQGHPHQPPWHLDRNTSDHDDLEAGRLHSLASLKWRQDTSAILQRLFSELAQTPEGDALGFVNLCTGVSHEWHNWSFLKHDPDVSVPMTRAFREWLRNKYGTAAALAAAWNDPSATFENAQLAGSNDRNRTLDGVFRDPQRERRVMDTFEAQQDVIADSLLHFDRLVKKLWPRPVAVGNFYGYYFMTFSRQSTGGHLAIKRVLRAPEVDFLAAPQSYYGPAHSMGGSGQSRAIIDSARLHGKLVIDEMDTFTHMKNNFHTPSADEQSDDIALIRRNTLHPISRGVGMWYYDFGPNWQTGWWGLPNYVAQARQMKAWLDGRLDKAWVSQADVLVVWDVPSYYHVAAGWTPISETTLDAVSNAIHKSGSVANDVYLDDLEAIDLSPYKVVVIANAWRLTTAQRALLQDRVMKHGRHVVFTYLPGYSDGTRNGFDLVSQAMGLRVEHAQPQSQPHVQMEGGAFSEMAFEIPHKTALAPFPRIIGGQAGVQVLGKLRDTKEPAFVRWQRGQDAVVWYTAVPITSGDAWRAIFRQAGAHVYEDKNDPLHSGNGVLWIHSAEGGGRQIRLRNGKSIELNLPPRSTAALDNETGAPLF